MCVVIGFKLLHIICQYHDNKACHIVSVIFFLPFHTHAIHIVRIVNLPTRGLLCLLVIQSYLFKQLWIYFCLQRIIFIVLNKAKAKVSIRLVTRWCRYTWQFLKGDKIVIYLLCFWESRTPLVSIHVDKYNI